MLLVALSWLRASGPTPPSDSPAAQAITAAGHGDAEPDVDERDDDRGTARRRASGRPRAPRRAAREGDEDDRDAEQHERHEDRRTCIEAGLYIRAGARADVPAASLDVAAAARRARFQLPYAAKTSLSGRQLVVVGGALLVVDHQQPLRTRAHRPRRRWRMATLHLVLGGVASAPPERFASWANTPAALPRAPGSAAGVGRARPAPDEQPAVRTAHAARCGHSAPTPRSISRWQCGQYASSVRLRPLAAADGHSSPCLGDLPIRRSAGAVANVVSGSAARVCRRPRRR